ncbi:hypothetical protein EIP91_009129 [Steccherinum ochraceum]|uniref:SPOR domain-containing protein n=1 Tax=Steccherinum ochraceum TaxID=92696 RepID=A0A4R0R216_9APHY|nr:hypothetical protein EIP91_009129 [Steccherinum ochraceum]
MRSTALFAALIAVATTAVFATPLPIMVSSADAPGHIVSLAPRVYIGNPEKLANMRGSAGAHGKVEITDQAVQGLHEKNEADARALRAQLAAQGSNAPSGTTQSANNAKAAQSGPHRSQAEMRAQAKGQADRFLGTLPEQPK